MRTEIRRPFPFFLAVLCLLIATFGFARVAAAAESPRVQAELLSEASTLAPGPNHFAVRLSPMPGWHTYWQNPGDAGQPTTLDWRLPAGFVAGPIEWPVPQAIVSGDIANIGYEHPTLHLVTIDVPATAAGRDANLQVEAHWLACADACIPEHATLALQRPVANEAVLDPQQHAAFDQARAQLPRATTAQMQYRIGDGQLRLRVDPAPAAWREAQLRLFTREGQWLDGSQAPQPHWDGDALVLTQAVRPDVEAVGGMLDGVLVVSGATGIAVHAAPAPVAVPSSETGTHYWLALLLAFGGGLVLNLMPCVFPVLSIKAVSLLQGAADPARQHRQALVYTAGVVLSCVAVAVATALLLVRAGGQALGWGFQLQSPFFVGLLAYLMFVMALSLSGALHIGGGLMGVGQNLAARDGEVGTFFTGVLAVIVASPCTAPFMGTALGYAMTQSWPLALSVFAMLGLGLASPFLLLAWSPRAARLLPRPGAWMDTFKQAMAFPLYFTVVWLLWVLGRQAGMAAVVAALSGLVLLAFCVWCLPRARWLRRVGAPAALAASIGLIAWPAQPAAVPAMPADAASAAAQWQPYSAAHLDALRQQGRTVFVDLTADWCITCKLNERVALDSAAARQAYAAHDVALLRGDWTSADPAITALLQRFGRTGVPLYLVFPPTGDAHVLPQLLTPGTVAAAFDP
ncbi:protein-disulfide reductase DsbD family protein [Solimonas terrae]|uniref:Thioredoxin domain-containing protein n=1 Tax=Solimonas terrae TaxID=1396819 RepID=A0A6M2BMP7_9GAMM|nr:thioredoxin family protein [Solimonas terrae]NGY03876.1 hypothetical protein [Solimonas terrae]